MRPCTAISMDHLWKSSCCYCGSTTLRPSCCSVPRSPTASSSRCRYCHPQLRGPPHQTRFCRIVCQLKKTLFVLSGLSGFSGSLLERNSPDDPHQPATQNESYQLNPPVGFWSFAGRDFPSWIEWLLHHL